jgi:hypothetical protein
MNRVAMVGSRAQGGVAHSAASRIPWQKRIAGTAIQSGGGFDFGPGGIWGAPKQRGGGRGVKKKMLKNQRGGWWSKETGEKLGFRQKGGFLKSLERSMFGVRRTKGKAKRPQRGAGWFDGVSQGMFGIKQTRGKKKREPAVIHSSARSYPQKGGRLGAGGPFFKKMFSRKQKGGLLGIGKLEKWYGGKSKKEQMEIDAWTAKNL